MLGGAAATTDNRSDPMGILVDFLKKVYTLCSESKRIATLKGNKPSLKSVYQVYLKYVLI